MLFSLKHILTIVSNINILLGEGETGEEEEGVERM